MRITKKVYVGAASLIVAAGAFVGLLSLTGASAEAMTITDRADCGYTDPIINCGAQSTEKLLQMYDANSDGRNPANHDIQAIFNYYGVTRSVLTNTSQIKHGWLDHTTGSISVDGKVVGTNAQSLYRVNVAGKGLSPVSIGGKTYYIGSVAGHYSKGADVFVFYKNGQPFTAIQASCGNPIPFTPKAQPTYECNGLTADKIERDRFRFTASASAQNGAQIVSYNYDFGDNQKLTTANTAVEHKYAKAGTYTAKVTVNVTVNGQTVVVPGANCQKTVTVEEIPVTPSYACEGLKISDKISRTEFEFEATASAENATIKSYTFAFGDGNSKVVTTNALTASTTHKYADKAATYTATVTITMSNGATKTSESCKVTVKVEEKPTEKNPSIEIVKTVNGKEHAKVAVGNEFTYEITVRNTGNVVLKDAVVTDKAPSQVTLLSASAGTITNNVWKYTIADLNIGASKSFTIKAKYAQYASGIHKNTVCVDTPTVPGSPDDCDEATTETSEKIKVCDLNDNTVKTIERSEFDESHMTTNMNDCGEIEVCIIENKVVKVIAKNEYDESTMTTDMSKCEETVTELPLTGVDTFIGGGLGLGSLTAASYYWVASRKNLLSTLLNR